MMKVSDDGGRTSYAFVTDMVCCHVMVLIVLHCEWGLMSRDGWALIDDHTNYALDSTYWWAGQNTDQTDLYYFGHGLNYKLALKEFISIAGRIAMVPKSASGVWWSRWLNLANNDLNEIVATYERLNIPLDVFILDMDWHTVREFLFFPDALRMHA